MAELTQNLSQFKQSPLVGQLDWTVNNNVVPVRLDPAYAGGLPLVAGQVFVLANVVGEVPVVTPQADATVTPYGVMIHTMKRDTILAGAYFDLALQGSTIYLQSSAAIARGAKVQNDPAGPRVATLVANTNASLGLCIDKPSAADQPVRVYIQPEDIKVAGY